MALGANKSRGQLPRGVIPALLIVLAVVLMTFAAREGDDGLTARARQVTMTVTTPLQQAGSFLGVPFRALSQIGSDTMAPEETLTELQQKNEELFALVGRLEEARLENERLKALLDLVDAYQLESATARILNHSSDSWNQVIIIDKGANDGIAIGMPVMSANGLLGQVESVGAFTSSVRLITDPSSGVSVFLQASRAEGILGGSPERLLYLNYMPIDSKVEPGDVVITSGAGGVFPKGIVIGEVVSSTHNLADVYLTVVVRPVSRVDSFEEVVVLTSRTAAVTTPDLSKLASPSSSSKDASASSASSSSASESTSANNSSESTSGISNYGADTSANSNDGDRSDSTSSNSSTGSELGPNSLSEGGD